MSQTTNRRSRTLVAAFTISLLLPGPHLFADSEDTAVLYLSGDRIQAGVAGQSSPRFDMPAVIATTGGGGPMIGMQRQRTYYGQEALEQSGATVSYAVRNGRIVDWNAFEKLVGHILSQKLGLEPDDIAVVTNESAASSNGDRERTTQLFFETFNVQGFFMSPNFTSWAHTSQLAADSTFAEALITRDEYDEHGPAIIHRKSER